MRKEEVDQVKWILCSHACMDHRCYDLNNIMLLLASNKSEINIIKCFIHDSMTYVYLVSCSFSCILSVLVAS